MLIALLGVTGAAAQPVAAGEGDPTKIAKAIDPRDFRNTRELNRFRSAAEQNLFGPKDEIQLQWNETRGLDSVRRVGTIGNFEASLERYLDSNEVEGRIHVSASLNDPWSISCNTFELLNETLCSISDSILTLAVHVNQRTGGPIQVCVYEHQPVYGRLLLRVDRGRLFSTAAGRECIAEPDLLAQMRRGSTLRISYLGDFGQSENEEIALGGFSAALELSRIMFNGQGSSNFQMKAGPTLDNARRDFERAAWIEKANTGDFPRSCPVFDTPAVKRINFNSAISRYRSDNTNTPKRDVKMSIQINRRGEMGEVAVADSIIARPLATNALTLNQAIRTEISRRSSRGEVDQPFVPECRAGIVVDSTYEENVSVGELINPVVLESWNSQANYTLQIIVPVNTDPIVYHDGIQAVFPELVLADEIRRQLRGTILSPDDQLVLPYQKLTLERASNYCQQLIGLRARSGVMYQCRVVDPFYRDSPFRP